MLNKINIFLVPLNISIIRNFPRKSVRFAKHYFKNKPIVVAEIGVFEGENSKSILKSLNVKKDYLIDPYEKYEDYSVEKSRDYSSLKLVKAKKISENRLKNYAHKIQWVRKLSGEAVKDITNDLDFVYVDGNHSYKYVKQDIKSYYKKLKTGGILAGHDIWYPDVSKAVCEFVAEKGLEPYFDRTDWWFIKK